MKYVILRDKLMLLPVIIPDHGVHASAVPFDAEVKGVSVHSAGHFHVLPSDKPTVYVKVHESEISTSLGIGPKPGDKKLLEAVLNNHGMYSFWFADWVHENKEFAESELGLIIGFTEKENPDE